MKLRVCQIAFLVVASVFAVGCHRWGGFDVPPAGRLIHPGPGLPGPGPGVAGPGPGVLPFGPPMQGPAGGLGETQVLFARPEGMQVRWDTGGGTFDSVPLIVPGRFNFQQGGIYRLKLTNIPNREGVELYPTLEIGPSTPRTEAFLAHNALPVQFTPEDFDQVLSGNFVTKVIYLPDPEFQELAIAGVETLVSTRLEPGVDPIVEADRRGAILGIIRLGNKDVEMPGAGGAPGGSGSVVPAFHGMPMHGRPIMAVPRPAPGVHPAVYGSGPAAGHHGAAAYPSAQLAPGAGMPPSHVAGISGPQWGSPITGTPIGLPGPPHLPMGYPAALQKHKVQRKMPEVHYLQEPHRHLYLHESRPPGHGH